MPGQKPTDLPRNSSKTPPVGDSVVALDHSTGGALAIAQTAKSDIALATRNTRSSLLQMMLTITDQEVGRMSLTQPLKWRDGKHYLAKPIIDLMPRHFHYIEAYGGGLALLLENDPYDPRHQGGNKGYEQGISEVVNDIRGQLMNFWRVLQGE